MNLKNNLKTNKQGIKMDYNEFLKKKIKKISEIGFDINDNELNTNLFDFEKFVVKRALKKGKYAIFAGCGLGKTIMQLDWARLISLKTNKPTLILTPLAVSGQTLMESEKFGILSERLNPESKELKNIPYVINYDQLDNINCSLFSGVVLDESSILKNFDGKTKTKIIESFKDTDYKLCCTATPSPNDPMEIGNHCEFLDVMTRNQMLSMFFIHDGGETSKWKLKGHAETKFYEFISSWAVMFENPSQIGFECSGYDLPKLNILESKIETPKSENGALFNDSTVSATDFNKELRRTIDLRLGKVAEIVNNSNESFIVWIKQTKEGEYLKKLIPDAIEVKGSDSTEWKESKLLGFAKNEFRVLITKSKIAQFGLNYQNCHNQIFPSLDFSFESLYQSIRRSYRFGQKSEVNIHIITTDTMQNVTASINHKQRNFEIMQNNMSIAVSNNLDDKLILKEESRQPVYNETYKLINGDSIKKIQEIGSESIGLSVFSPPFASLYTYSSHYEDLGNSGDYNEFIKHFEYLVKELFRVTIQGRNVCVHCMDLPIQKGKEGYIGLRDFSGMILRLFESVGFVYHSRVTIWKNPATEMQRTKALGLLHKQLKKDATMSRVGIPDYVLIFRKDGVRNNPVNNDNIPVDLWQKYASPVWFDINQSNTLQGFRDAKEDKDEKHICPLQLDVIERLITLYSNENDYVFTPFMGIGSEVYQAVKMKRRAIGIELKESYFDIAVKNVKAAYESVNAPTLF